MASSDEALQAVASDWRSWPVSLSHAPRVLSELQGGLTNRSYLVDVAGERLVLRIGHAVTGEPGIDRVRELTVLRAVSAAGLGPRILGATPERGWLLSEYLAGEQSVAGALGTARLEVLIETLRAVHGLPVRAASFSYPDHYAALYRAAGGAGPLPAGIEKSLKALVNAVPTGLTHHDPGPGNVIFSGESARLIDWEYAAPGCPLFDWAAVALDWQVGLEELSGELAISSAMLEDACALHRALCAWWTQALESGRDQRSSNPG